MADIKFEERQRVLLRAEIYRLDEMQALLEIKSMEGPYSLRVPLSELRLDPEEER